MNSTTKSDNSGIATAKFISFVGRRYIGWKAAAYLIASMAVLHTVATWDWDGQISSVNRALRHYSFPVVWLELVILLLAARLGWRPYQQFSCLPVPAKWLFSLLCVSVGITSIFVSGSPITSTLFAIRFLLHGLLIGSLIFLASADHEFDFKNWVAPLSWGIALYLFALTAFCLLVPDPASFPWVQRIPSATNIRQIGNVLGLMALVPATLLLFERSMPKARFAALLLMALLSFIMWSGSRGALLGVCVATLFAGWHCRTVIATDRAMLLAFAFGVALTVSLFLPVPDPNFGLIRMAEAVASSEPSAGRWQVWQSTVEAIKTNLLFGHGAGTYRGNMEALTGQPFNHPHNFILQFTYDWGIVGGGLAMGLLAWLGFSVISSEKGTVEERFISTGGLAGIVTMAMIDGALYYPLPIIIVVALMVPRLVRDQL